MAGKEDTIICFMAGFPFGGKTYVLNKIAECIDMIVICPKDFRPDDYSGLNQTERANTDISSWQCALDQLEIAIRKYEPSQVIVFDTSCASLDAMKPYFEKAKYKKHCILYILVMASIKLCKERAGSKWPLDNIIDRYKENFNKSIPNLINMSNKHFVVNNESQEPDVNNIIEWIKTYRQKDK